MLCWAKCLQVFWVGLVCVWGTTGALAAKAPFTPRKSIELAQIAHRIPFGSPETRPGEIDLKMEHFVTVSPDGQRFTLALYRGDIERNGYWAEILVGRLGSSLAETGELKTVARMFGKAYEGSPVALKAPEWQDNSQVTVRWEDESGRGQLFTVDVDKAHVLQLTQSERSVYGAYAIHGATVIYGVKTDPKQGAERLSGDSGYTLSNQDDIDFLNLVRGFRVTPEHHGFEIWLRREGTTPARLGVTKMFDGIVALRTARIAPSGKSAVLLPPAASSVAGKWRGYDLSGRSSGANLLQLHLIDFSNESVRMKALLDAPFVVGAAPVGPSMAWSADSRSVVIAPTFLPRERSSESTEEGAAAAIVNVETGRYEVLPLPGGFLTTPLQVLRDTPNGISPELSRQGAKWIKRDEVEIVGRQGEALHFRRGKVSWLSIRSAASEDVRTPVKTVSLQLRQGRNLPPAVYAIDSATGARKLILDPTPELRGQMALGKVELIQWTDELNGKYEGELIYPIDHDASRRYPLVIQTGGVPQHGAFELNNWTSVCVGQTLASKGIFYLRLDPLSRSPEVENISVGFGAVLVAGVKAALQHLDERQLIDTGKVGLTGFSNGGFRVLHLLTQSNIPFAAAVASDNADGSYMQAMHANEMIQSWSPFMGSEPFGKGLERWLELSPGFNADRIRTPLRMENQSQPLAARARSTGLTTGSMTARILMRPSASNTRAGDICASSVMRRRLHGPFTSGPPRPFRSRSVFLKRGRRLFKSHECACVVLFVLQMSGAV